MNSNFIIINILLSDLWKNELIRKFKFYRANLISEAVLQKQMEYGNHGNKKSTETRSCHSKSPMKERYIDKYCKCTALLQ